MKKWTAVLHWKSKNDSVNKKMKERCNEIIKVEDLLKSKLCWRNVTINERRIKAWDMSILESSKMGCEFKEFKRWKEKEAL